MSIRGSAPTGKPAPYKVHALSPAAERAELVARLRQVGADATISLQRSAITKHRLSFRGNPKSKIPANPQAALSVVKIALKRMHEFHKKATASKKKEMKTALTQASHEWESLAKEASSVFVQTHQEKMAHTMRSRINKNNAYDIAGKMRKIALAFERKAREEKNPILHHMYHQASHVWGQHAATVDNFARRQSR